jgi:hypothetical protein
MDDDDEDDDDDHPDAGNINHNDENDNKDDNHHLDDDNYPGDEVDPSNADATGDNVPEYDHKPHQDDEDVRNNEDGSQHNNEDDDDHASPLEEPQDNGTTEEHEDAVEDGVNATDEPQRSAQAHTHNLRGNKRDYSHRLANMMNDPASSKSYNAQFLQQPAKDQDTCRVYGQQFLQHAIETIDKSPKKAYGYICEFMFNQMTADGIKKHGQLAIDALMAEFTQLDGLNVFKGIQASTLMKLQKKEALRAINLIKEKRCGIIKGRTVADGRAQCNKYDKVETTSPTMSNDALMLTFLVDALERRAVATADVPGAYLHADMDDFTLLKFVGHSVDILCKTNPEYEKFVTEENGKKVLYLQLLKALYGCIKSAMLWYELFVDTLKSMGFVLNPYDLCVANKMINGKQCTIAWYVDDLKVSHVDKSVVGSILDTIESKFRKLAITTRKKHTYL